MIKKIKNFRLSIMYKENSLQDKDCPEGMGYFRNL